MNYISMQKIPKKIRWFKVELLAFLTFEFGRQNADHQRRNLINNLSANFYLICFCFIKVSGLY